MTAYACHNDDRFTSDFADERKKVIPLCHECPIQVSCLQGALARKEAWGVWGGRDMAPGRNAYDVDEAHPPCPTCGRPFLRRQGEGAARYRARTFCNEECARNYLPPINHGSPSGARAHQRRGEKPCAECLRANAEAEAQRTRRAMRR